MRDKRRIFGIAALMSVLLAVPLVLSLGIVDVSKFSFGSPSSTVEPASTVSVFVAPAKILDTSLQPGSTFTVHVNISGVTDLFAWQINMSWNKAILNVSRIIPGEFLARSYNLTSSEELGWVVNSTDNAKGYSSFADTILGDVSGIGGSGRLVSIEFLVVGYGRSNLTINVSGTSPTILLDSTGSSITFIKTEGYFSNLIPSDLDADGDVDQDDFILFGGYYPTSVVDPESAKADLDGDGDVDQDDFILFGGYYPTP